MTRFLIKRLAALVAIFCAGLTPVATFAADEVTSAVKVGGFESPTATPWNWGHTDACQATGELNKAEHYGGQQSFKMTSASPLGANVYAGLSQTISVKPSTAYRVSLWCKGKDVGQCWVGGGASWTQRKALPPQTYDWTQVEFDVKSGDNENTFELRVNVDSTTQALWIDDVTMTEAVAKADARIHDPTVIAGLSPAARLYPVPSQGAGPVLGLRASDDPAFGADIQIAYEPKGLRLNVHVLDPTPGPACEGEPMWTQDCIQVGIDTNPTAFKDAYAGSCFELGFALVGDGRVAHYAWFSGGGPFDFGNTREQGTRDATGYRLNLLLGWESLGVRAGQSPGVIGLNVVVSDGTGPKGRRFVEWTPGITAGKSPNQFAHLVRVDEQTNRATDLRVDAPMYDRQDTVVACFAEFTTAGRPAGPMTFVTKAKDRPSTPMAASQLPALPANSTRQVLFTLPAEQLDEGDISLSVAGVDGQTIIRRLDLKTRIPKQCVEVQQRADRLRQSIQNNPAIKADAYVEMGFQLTDRYLRKILAGEAGANATWSWLQLEELDQMLDKTAARISQLQSGKPSFEPLAPVVGPITVKNGIYTFPAVSGATRPGFIYGYGHFGQVVKDLEFFPKLGASLVQQELGTSALNEDGTLSPAADTFVEMLHRAASAGERVDVLISPHYFPEWAAKTTPDLAAPGEGSFFKQNIYHPKFAEVTETYLKHFIPRIKDEPAVVSLCLTNEPVYRWAGMDKYSRPAWTDYLRTNYRDIGSLNSSYGSQYADFADVPAPVGDTSPEIGPRRMYFDWVLFNQASFTRWHARLNQIVKELAPKLPTHVKMMAQIFDRTRLHDGPEPEAICGITDLAGNDCWANPTPGARYGYGWKLEESWYELLHSFRGQPVFNSENHLIPDGAEAQHIPAGATSSVLWQGALHHQAATAIWVWEQPTHPDLMGSIYQRPSNVFEAGKTMFDLRRLAGEVTAISSEKARVALLYSVPSIYWEDDYTEVAQSAFAALQFLGLPVTFISEKQLAEGSRSAANEKVDWIVIPHATHVRQATIDGLSKFVAGGGHLIAVGPKCLSFDEYHRERASKAVPLTNPSVTLSNDEAQLAPAFEAVLTRAGVTAGTLKNNEGKTVFGVEYRLAKHGSDMLVPMINFLPKTLEVRLSPGGKAIDLISGETVDLSAISLKGLEPRLLKINATVLGN